MYLRRLELFGFKSFVEKTELEFSPGISAIVGPNGCGKSNLADAVRWALGEQSVKLLRGTKMEEIIFGGTDSRRALNYAEISLTFAQASSFLNLEYEEVSVTRKLYRSGESEYFINKTLCRLKDIVDLFVDTGIGRNLYSFIGQGKVEEIINARAEERRELFEEAAAILKYKRRKREAQKRLREMQDNLIRVHDLILELGSQLEPLAEQSALAQRYKQMRFKLISLERKLLRQSLNDSRLNYQKLTHNLQKTESELRENSSALLKIQTSVDKLTSQEQEIKTKRDDIERNMINLNANLDKMEREIEATGDRLRDLSTQVIEKQNICDNLVKRLSEVEDRRGEYCLELEEKIETECKIKDESAGFKEELETLGERSDNGEAFYNLQAELAEISIEKIEKKQLLEKLLTEQVRLKEKQGTLRKLIEEQKKQLFGIKNRKKSSERSVQTLQKEILALEKEKVECKSLLEKVEESLDDLAQKRRGVLEHKHSLESKCLILKEQEESHAGYYQGVKNVLQEERKNQHLKGIYGPVAALIKVPREYETAIEVAFGSALQYIVTVNEAVAKRAINYLKESKGGRATFLPLNIIQSDVKKVDRELLEHEKVIGVASELVSTELRFEQVVNFLIGRIIVTENMEVALLVGRRSQFRQRIVTLEGELINPGGAITGGSIYRKRNSLFIGRKREINDLETELRRLEEELIALDKEQEKFLFQIKELQGKLKRADSLYQQKEGLLFTCRRNLVEHDKEDKELFASLGGKQKEYANAIEEQGRVEEQCLLLTSKIKITEQQENQLKQEVEGLRLSNEEMLNKAKAIEGKISDARVLLAAIEQRKIDIQENIGRLSQLQAQLDKEMKQQESSILSLKSKIEELKSIRAQKVDSIKEMQKIQLEKESRLHLIIQQHGVLKEELSTSHEEIEVLQQREQNLKQRKHRAEIRIVRVEEGLKHLEGKLADDRYKGISEEEAEEERERLDSKAIEEEISFLKEALSQMGDVNLGAIEEHSRLSERVNFLEVQQNDLQVGEQELRKVLKEIDSQMEVKFKETFALINENFKEIFQALFNGGKAYLSLNDELNVLESGIEIIAQPPGKKLQNITLLSAGEKALTAIALLFAVLRQKPTSFCILDEVETSLDEQNVAKFTDYLRNNLSNVQFILITHRQQTAKEADALYGVTMEEPGISKLVSVNLMEKAG